MKSLLRCYSYIKRFYHYSNRDKLLIVEVFILTAIFRMAMLTIPFKKLKKYMGDLNKESSYEIDKSLYKEIGRIKWSIEKVAKHTPWESKCLVQALTAQFLLSRKKIDSTLYLGVSRKRMFSEEMNDQDNKSDFIAHSWIRCGDLFVTGGNGEKFAVVAKFGVIF